MSYVLGMGNILPQLTSELRTAKGEGGCDEDGAEAVKAIAECACYSRC